MKLCSTKDASLRVGLKDAIFTGLPADNGLYLPTQIPLCDPRFIQEIGNYSLPEIAFTVAQTLIGDEISAADLKNIITRSITFDAPVVNIHDDIYVLELFHGPSLAFKDFGARFMAGIMSYYLEQEDQDINILVATSGDTGSAVAQGFLGVERVKVTILYPSGRVSNIQEKQLTTLGQNITALEVDGTFDDCQQMVKSAFLDDELRHKLRLTSANSINISRLIPQMFYYFYAYAKLAKLGKPIVFSVPSGNFGNLCAGVIAKKMGLPIAKFIASTNINSIVPDYLATGVFTPRASQSTISNAMDVGNPSNFTRLDAIYGHNLDNMRTDIVGKSYTDEQVKAVVKDVYTKFGYILDPHGAIGYIGLMDYLHESNLNVTGVFLETAHPAKFHEDIESVLGREVDMPESLQQVLHRQKHSIKIAATPATLKEFLLG